MSKHIGKNISKNLSSKKLKAFKRFLITLNNPPQMHLKFLQKQQFTKTAKATGDLVINKIVDKITKVSRTLPIQLKVKLEVWHLIEKQLEKNQKKDRWNIKKKKKNLLDNTPDQQSKFRTKNWFETNNDSLGM